MILPAVARLLLLVYRQFKTFKRRDEGMLGGLFQRFIDMDDNGKTHRRGAKWVKSSSGFTENVKNCTASSGSAFGGLIAA